MVEDNKQIQNPKDDDISFSTNDFQDYRFFTLQGLSKIIIQKIRDK